MLYQKVTREESLDRMLVLKFGYRPILIWPSTLPKGRRRRKTMAASCRVTRTTVMSHISIIHSKHFLLLYRPTTFNFCADLAIDIKSGNSNSTSTYRHICCPSSPRQDCCAELQFKGTKFFAAEIHCNTLRYKSMIVVFRLVKEEKDGVLHARIFSLSTH